MGKKIKQNTSNNQSNNNKNKPINQKNPSNKQNNNKNNQNKSNAKIQSNSQQTNNRFQVFITGLPYQTTQTQIKLFFSFAESPIIKLPKYQDTGRCLGYGHVQFKSKQQYDQALTKNGQHIGSRYINVQQARGRKEIQSQAKTVPVGCKVLFIKNLPYQITQDQVNQQFSSSGIIKDVRMIRNWQTKKFKGFVYIDYKDNGSVKKAIQKYHNKPYKGRYLICDAVTTQMKKGFKRFIKPQDQQAQNQNQEYNQQQNNQDDEQ